MGVPTIALDNFAQEAKDLIADAQNLADEKKHALVEPVHLLVRAVDRDRAIAEVFRRAGADPADIVREGEGHLLRLGKTATGLAYLSNAMLSLLDEARKLAKDKPVGKEELLNALTYEIRGPAAAILQAHDIGPGTLRTHMAALREVPPAGGGDE